MQLEQQFTIPTDAAHAWDLLMDVERIAPCFPGATVIATDGDNVSGQVKVKLGPIVLTYAGVLKFVERDESARRLVMDGQGTDAKGNGSASAKVTALLVENADGSTRCSLVTDLNITGRPAQFGRGMMLEIGNNILGKFSDNLAAMLTAESAEPPAPPSAAHPDDHQPASAGTEAKSTASPIGIHRVANSKPAPVVAGDEPLDLLRAAGGATAKRVIPVAIAAAVLVGLVILLMAK